MGSRPTASATSVAGLLLLDSALNLISSDREAVQILSYPEKTVDIRRLDALLNGRIRAAIRDVRSSDQSSVTTEYTSGRRRYICRVFRLDSGSKGRGLPSVAVLLERSPSGLVPMSQICQRFNLSRRERETVEYLLQGLSSKEIADRMKISPNTVNTFFRLVMLKIGVSTRSGILAKMITASFDSSISMTSQSSFALD
jgi:DNA-binding CsgD family transcriptional regulator